QLVDQRAHLLQFVVMEDGVEGGEYPCVVAAGELHQLGDLADLVAGIVPRAEARSAEVKGIGPLPDGLPGGGHLAGRAEQFQMVLRQGHGVSSLSAWHGKARIVAGKAQAGTPRCRVVCCRKSREAWASPGWQPAEVCAALQCRRLLLRYSSASAAACRASWSSRRSR